jgi:hypothetical protein
MSASEAMGNGTAQGQPGSKWCGKHRLAGLTGPKKQDLEVSSHLLLSVANYSDHP